MRWVLAASAVIALSAAAIGSAGAQPTQPPAPGPGPTSTSDELTDMVMDAIEHGDVAAPTTTLVPAPPR